MELDGRILSEILILVSFEHMIIVDHCDFELDVAIFTFCELATLAEMRTVEVLASGRLQLLAERCLAHARETSWHEKELSNI